MKKLNAHPAAAQANTEKIRFTFRGGLVLKYTNKPNPKFTNAAKNNNSCRKPNVTPKIRVNFPSIYSQSARCAPHHIQGNS